MDIKLNWIHIKNFKGIRDFKLDLNGKNASVFADNGKGKTTLMDAFLWLLFGKDSSDDKNFTVKPQDGEGKDINHLQTLVEADYLIDGKPLKIKKMYEENWVKRHGATDRVLDGHTNTYWFNEVPTKAREYQSKIGDLINENIFKMITNPLFFNTKLSWQDRRKILLEISGDATDEEVISSDESLSGLTELLGNRTIEEYKLVLADQLKGFKKERDDLPPRIDELTLSLPQEEPDYKAVENEINKHKETLSGIEFLLTNATTKANELSKKYQELARLKSNLEIVKEKIKSESGADRKKLIDEKSELLNGKTLLQSNIQDLENQINRFNNTLTNNAIDRADLLSKWNEYKETRQAQLGLEFKEPSEDNFICPTCEQDLPTESKESKLAEMKKKFTEERQRGIEWADRKLEENKNAGLKLKADTEKAQSDLDLSKKELAEKNIALENLEKKTAELDEEISKPVAEPDYTKNQEYNQLIEKIEQLQTELDKPVEDKSSGLLQEKSNIQLEIEARNRVLNVKEEVEKKKIRIEELKAEEKRVSTLIAELEGHKFLLERFTVAKVNLLEDSINSQFKHVKFKLFEENITNEGIKETCVALVNTNGSFVDYNTNGNLAGTYNAGLDIINSLCRFYGVTAPIFIDNRESVSEIIENDSQVINLIKPPTWNELDSEVQEILTAKNNGDLEGAKKAWNDRNKTLRVKVEE